MLFTLVEPGDERWKSFLGRVKHDVYHEPGYVRLLAQERAMAPCACYGASEDAAFLLPLLLDELPESLGLAPGLRDARSPDGYPAPLYAGEPSDVPGTLQDFMTFLQSERIISAFVRTHPLLGLPAADFASIGDVVARGQTVPVFLDAPYEEILLRMRQGHRYEIRRARRRGYRVLVDRWDLYPRFVELYRALMDRVDAAEAYRFSDAYFAGLPDALGEAVHLAVVTDRHGATAAGALFTAADDVVQYHLAAGDPAFGDEAVQKCAIDAIIRWGLDHGASVVHLGGGVGAENDSLFHFKAGFAKARRNYHTIHLLPDPESTADAVDAWRRLHGGKSPDPGYFPPYRAPLPT